MPSFDSATPPWAWKVTYGILGMGVGAIIMTTATLIGIDAQERADKERTCWDPPPSARAWANVEVIGDGAYRPLVCARRADNNGGMFPHAHRCIRMVPCEDK